MNIEILHGRDPDSGCDHTVFVDGERVDHVTVEDIDPGRGYTREDWDEHTEWVESSTSYSPAFRDAVLAEREEAGDSQYIADEEDQEKS